MGLKAEQLSYFAKYIEEKTGIVYSDNNYYQLEMRLGTIAKSLGLNSGEELWEKSKGGISGTLSQILLDTATNNETLFFRDKKVFGAIENYCIPKLKEMRPLSLVHRVWSAACSNGQEPYSLAMTYAELISKGLKVRCDIWATDFSDRVLGYARQGVYSQLEVQRGLPSNLMIKYFTKNPDDTWAISKDLVRQVRFARLNLLEPWPASELGFDMILCRNVLIYQNTENKKKVLRKIEEKLGPNGFLILGGAESLIGLSDQFNQVTFEGAVLYQRKY